MFVCLFVCVCVLEDGELSHREFVSVMKSRTTRGLEKVGNTNKPLEIIRTPLSVSELPIVYFVYQSTSEIRTPL